MKYKNYILTIIFGILLTIYNVDIPLAILLQDLFKENTRKIFYIITDFGSFTYIVAINIIIILYLFFRYKKSNNNHYLQQTKLMLIGAAAQSISALIIQLLKFIFGRVRPFHYLSEFYGGYKTFTFFNFQEEFKSFPSGHSAGIWALITCIIIIFKDNKYSKLLIIPGILISISRLILDMHYLSDILTGALLGIFITAITMKFLRKNFLQNTNQ